jgi:hypothetical protein
VQAAEPGAYAFIYQAIIFSRAFPAHTADQADDLLGVGGFAGLRHFDSFIIVEDGCSSV